MITDEDYRALQINCLRMEREMKAMRQALLDDFAKAALIAYWSDVGPDTQGIHEAAEWSYAQAKAMIEAREALYGTR